MTSFLEPVMLYFPKAKHKASEVFAKFGVIKNHSNILTAYSEMRLEQQHPITSFTQAGNIKA